MKKPDIAIFRDGLPFLGLALAAILLSGRWDMPFMAAILLAALAAYGLALGFSRRKRTPEEKGAAPPLSRPGAEAAFLEAIADPLILIDRARIVLAANRAASARFGADLPGQSLLGFLRHPDLLAALEASAAVDAGPRFVEIAEKRGETYLCWIADWVADGEGRRLLHIRDVTALRRAEDWKSEFVANVSHELKSPLAIMIGALETLLGPAREDVAAREKFLALMLKEAERMNRLTADLLSLSRIELNEHQRPRDPVDLAQVLPTILEPLALKAAAKNMRILAPGSALPIIAGDREELGQALRNLLENAIQYGDAGTEIRLTIERVEAWEEVRRLLPRAPEAAAALRIAIADRGPGIAREHLPRLTERFYCVDPARSRHLGGTGLGLAIVKHIAHRHRGALHIDSVLGEGSVFSLALPL